MRIDCYIVCPNAKIVTSQQLKTLTNFYKEEIYQKLQGKTVGKTVVIWSNNLDVIYSAVCAIWELGCAVAVHDFDERIVTHPAFKNFYSYIDLIIGDDQVLPNIPYIPALGTQLSYYHYEHDLPEPDLWQLDPLEYPDKEYTLDQPVDSDTVCVVSHSSGTTGEPKICTISHANAIDLVKENIKIFNFTDCDRVLHYKTLHHGSLFLNYAIPAFASTAHHEWFVRKNSHVTDQYNLGVLSACVELCCDNRLTKWLVPYDNLQNLPMLPAADLSHCDLVTVVGPTTVAVQQIFKKFNPRAVFNNFGCTEIGTIAVSKTSADNAGCYRPNQFSMVNSLLDLQVHKNQFCVKYKKEKNWKTVGDIVTVDRGIFTWHGRNSAVTFDQTEIAVSDIVKWMHTILKIRYFSVVADFQENKIYLAVFEKTKYDLGTVNQQLQPKFGSECQFSDMRYFEFDHVLNGVKPSQPILLYAFKNEKNYETS